MTDRTPQPPEPTLVDHPLPMPASERTLVDSKLDPDLRTRTLATQQSSDRLVPQPTTVPVIPDVSIELRLNATAPSATRYAIGPLLGTGSSSHVYGGLDRTFEREVAIKFLESGLAKDAKRLSRFIREARMTANLDHPNIVPVYDLNATPTGDLYLTMRQVKGLSLGEAVRRAADGDLPPELGDLNRRVNILLKVCDALACAHDRGIAHLDVKPDNIMLGPFGEVVVVDWGLARRFDEAPRARQQISGTPAYMSPEQSSGHPGDALADIYCLGATLFHMLTLRHPTWGSDETEFWAKKRAGVIDPPTPEERARIPKPLLAIALKALAFNRDERYATVKALGEDLQHYQAGQAVSAYRESRLERAIRWHRRNARTFWTSLAVSVLVIASAVYAYGERLKEVVAWGAPIYRQDFSDDSWRADFIDVDYQGMPSHWERQDGRIVSTGAMANFLFLPRRFYGPVAVEVEGEMQPGKEPGDLSLSWSANDPAADPNWRNDAYLLQTGSYGNTYVGIASAGGTPLARSNIRLKSGVRYRLRFEIDDDRLSIDLDGRRICEYRSSLPCTSGYVGLHAYYPGKAFDNIAVYAKGVPQRVPPTAIGDYLYRRNKPEDAAEQYGLVAEAFAGTTLGDQARYKQGLCMAKLNKHTEALTLWSSLRDHDLINLVDCRRIEWSNADGDVTGAVARFANLYRNEPALRPRLHLLFATALDAAYKSRNPKVADQWLTLTRGLLPSEPTVDAAAAKVLFNFGQWETVLERYPHIERQAGLSLIGLGRSAEALSRFPEVRLIKMVALFDLGRFDDVLRSDVPDWSNRVYHARGQHEQALQLGLTDPDAHALDLIYLGRAREALLGAPLQTRGRYRALIHLGRCEEVAAEAKQYDPSITYLAALMRLRRFDEIMAFFAQSGQEAPTQAYFGRWLMALERHDEAAASKELNSAEHTPFTIDQNDATPWFTRLIAADFVRAHGDAESFATAMRSLAQRGPGWRSQIPWHAARYLLGEIDDAAYLAQPASEQAKAALLVLRGMRAELAGDRYAAAANYRAYLALPLYRRMWDIPEGDPIVDQFVAWRLAELVG